MQFLQAPDDKVYAASVLYLCLVLTLVVALSVAANLDLYLDGTAEYYGADVGAAACHGGRYAFDRSDGTSATDRVCERLPLVNGTSFDADTFGLVSV